MHGPSRRSRVLIAILAVTLVSACAAQYRQHGYIPPEEDLQTVVVGVDTRDTVAESIGVPTTSGVRNDTGYYYIRSQVRHFAARRPEVVDRTVLAIYFDGSGVVQDIVTYGLEDGRVVPISRRVTRSGDSKLSFIRQLFGNIGGFSLEGLLN